jgi:hypothetical protein
VRGTMQFPWGDKAIRLRVGAGLPSRLRLVGGWRWEVLWIILFNGAKSKVALCLRPMSLSIH